MLVELPSHDTTKFIWFFFPLDPWFLRPQFGGFSIYQTFIPPWQLFGVSTYWHFVVLNNFLRDPMHKCYFPWWQTAGISCSKIKHVSVGTNTHTMKSTPVGEKNCVFSLQLNSAGVCWQVIDTIDWDGSPCTSVFFSVAPTCDGHSWCCCGHDSGCILISLSQKVTKASSGKRITHAWVSLTVITPSKSQLCNSQTGWVCM